MNNPNGSGNGRTIGPYLELPFAWTSSRQFAHGKVSEYRLKLQSGDVALLRLVADKGWAMTIRHGTGQPDTDRGLFGTPDDALMVLVGETGLWVDSDATRSG